MNAIKTIDRHDLAVAVLAFAKLKPGFDHRNYGSQAAFASDYRRYKTPADKNRSWHKYELIGLFSALDDTTLRQIWAGSGRLTYNATRKEMDYCVGQYYPTEYQGALFNALQMSQQAAQRSGWDR